MRTLDVASTGVPSVRQQPFASIAGPATNISPGRQTGSDLTQENENDIRLCRHSDTLRGDTVSAVRDKTEHRRPTRGAASKSTAVSEAAGTIGAEIANEIQIVSQGCRQQSCIAPVPDRQ